MEMEPSKEAVHIVMVAAILWGAVQCFYGFRIFKVILGVMGCALGASVGAYAAMLAGAGPVVLLLLAVVGAVAGAVLLVAFSYIGVFLLGAQAGVGLGLSVMAAMGMAPEPVITLLVAILGGVAALFAFRFMIIFSTAFSGAGGMVYGIAYFTVGKRDPMVLEGLVQAGGEPLYAMLAGGLVVALAGIYLQYRNVPEAADGIGKRKSGG